MLLLLLEPFARMLLLLLLLLDDALLLKCCSAAAAYTFAMSLLVLDMRVFTLLRYMSFCSRVSPGLTYY